MYVCVCACVYVCVRVCVCSMQRLTFRCLQNGAAEGDTEVVRLRKHIKLLEIRAEGTLLLCVRVRVCARVCVCENHTRNNRFQVNALSHPLLYERDVSASILNLPI